MTAKSSKYNIELGGLNMSVKYQIIKVDLKLQVACEDSP